MQTPLNSGKSADFRKRAPRGSERAMPRDGYGSLLLLLGISKLLRTEAPQREAMAMLALRLMYTYDIAAQAV